MTVCGFVAASGLCAGEKVLVVEAGTVASVLTVPCIVLCDWKMLSDAPSVVSRIFVDGDEAKRAYFSFSGGFRFGALRSVRWRTCPEGRISLTRKSVYLGQIFNWYRA